jgi:hAT family C-terminal dimerisation region
VSGSPQKVDFTSRYRNLPQAFTDEVQEYFKLPRENFDTCDPLRWWAGRCSQFPNLSRFARDILSIPGKFTTDLFLPFNHLQIFLSSYAGSAVAVERIFSGSRDTISLRRASLNPETIRTLMLVKQQLRLARTAVHDILGG